jgi:hypothetical protein
MCLHIAANLTEKFLALLNSFNSVASLMETCIAGVTINHLISVIALSTKTDLAVSLKQALHFL